MSQDVDLDRESDLRTLAGADELDLATLDGALDGASIDGAPLDSAALGQVLAPTADERAGLRSRALNRARSLRPFPRAARESVTFRRVVDTRVPAALATRPLAPVVGMAPAPQPVARAVGAPDVAPVPADAAPAQRAEDRGDDVPRWMRTAGGYAWRLLALAGVLALVVFATARVQLVFVAVFLGLVLTSVLRPLVNRLSRFLPRFLATGVALLGAALLVAALVGYVVNSVASQWPTLAVQFNDGTRQLLTFLENREGRIPVTITPEMITAWIETGRTWVGAHAADLATGALASAGSVAEVFGALALGVFCSVFFLARGAQMWTWFLNQLPARTRQTWHDAGGAGWYTFSGYARGTVIIALADGLLAGLALVLLGVPLAAPLAVLVFIGAFIPIIGAPLAMLVAMVVALAANGPLNAVLVGVVIALIGQFEGHVLQPLVMGRQVSLHPVVVALAVTAGTLLAGILGAIVAVPVVAVAWTVYAKLRNVDPPLSAPLPTIKVVRKGRV